MAQFLDVNGLQTVVKNVKNLTTFSFLPIGYYEGITISNSLIKNTTPPSTDFVLVYNTVRRKLFALYNNYYYTQWGDSIYYYKHNMYGTSYSTGVIINHNFPFYCYADNSLHRFDNGDIIDLVAKSQTPTWITVWQKGYGTIQTKTPFKDNDGYITKVERTTNNVTENYIWRITILNNDGESQQFAVTRGNYIVSDGINIDNGEEGSFCIELSPAAPKGVYTVTY